MFLYKFKKVTTTKEKLFISRDILGIFWFIEHTNGTRTRNFSYDRFINNKLHKTFEEETFPF